MSRLISLALGVYTGVYLCQNYQIPQLPGPVGLWEKIKSISKQFEKNDKD
uniref:Uncharacterized protein n=1 Tax=Arion vulgaris TaxID=1028688 RepID=A0A0B7AFJ8_9EUPU